MQFHCFLGLKVGPSVYHENPCGGDTAIRAYLCWFLFCYLTLAVIHMDSEYGKSRQVEEKREEERLPHPGLAYLWLEFGEGKGERREERRGG